MWRLPKKWTFCMPVLTDTLSRNLEVLTPYGADTSQTSEGRRVIEHSYIITGFEPGMQMVPSQRVIYSYNSNVDTALSMPLMIQVYAPVVDTSQQIKPIKPPINTPLTLEGGCSLGRPRHWGVAGRNPDLCPDLDVPAKAT